MPALLRPKRRSTHTKARSLNKTTDFNEAAIQDQIISYLELYSPDVRVLRMQTGGTPYTDKGGTRYRPSMTRGMTDLIVIAKGEVWFVEVKTRSGKVSPHQEAMHQSLTAAKANVLIARCLEDVMFIVVPVYPPS